jgi:hypothetical protein
VSGHGSSFQAVGRGTGGRDDARQLSGLSSPPPTDLMGARVDLQGPSAGGAGVAGEG